MYYRFYIGYEDREHAGFQVCSHSLQKRSSEPIVIAPLEHRTLRSRRLFSREWKIDRGGQYWDLEDKKPFSTTFAHSRFLVPHIARGEGASGWVAFCDLDFLFLADPVELFDLADPRYAVMCVKEFGEPQRKIKMDGMIQSKYPKKLWSSLVLWNLDHERNEFLTPDIVSTQTGTWLHGFEWLDEDEIGTLPREWNYVPGISKTLDKPKAIHYSQGLPFMPGYEKSEKSDLWITEYMDFLGHRRNN